MNTDKSDQGKLASLPSHSASPREKQFRMKDVDPGDTLAFKIRGKNRAPKEALAIGVQAPCRVAGQALRPEQMGRAVNFFKRWMPLVRTAPSSMSCRASTRRAARSILFKSPSVEDLDHDYLWRCMKCLPNRGHIGIFKPELLRGKRW